MDHVRLSICIATYNRADYIGETLESILPQVTNAVEVVVVDGASTDHTEDVVRRYCERCSNIRYIRLAAKGGVDKDYNLSVEHAKGDYCWLFTDDDILNPGAVQAVIAELDNNYPLIIVNANVKDSKLLNIIETKRLPISENVVYPDSDLEDFFINTAGYMSFIGCVVVRRSIWMERERVKYYGFEFIHLGVIFQKPLPASVLVLAQPYITIRFGNAQWTSRAFEIWMFKWPAIIWGFNYLSVSARAKITPQEPWRKIPKLALLRAEGKFTVNDYNRFVKTKINFWERVTAVLLLLTPARILNLLAIVCYLNRSRNSELVLYTLRNTKCYWKSFITPI